MDEATETPMGHRGVDRRTFLRRLAVGAAFTAPVIASGCIPIPGPPKKQTSE
ncbi:MAG: hypothetical protein M3Z03_13910 [Actinomycetota bacterium]|nr:hypothetical protein [Actinomycetota bacterium]